MPDPVGAWIRVWLPAAIASQPSRWASVGATNVDSNQARVAGAKKSGRVIGGSSVAEGQRTGRV